MSGSTPLNTLFDVSTIRLLLESCPLLSPVLMLIVESFLLFKSVALFPVLSVSIDPSLLVSAAPPAFASGVDPLTFVISADHSITKSERTIPGLFLPSGSRLLILMIDSIISSFIEYSLF